jgi:predicted ATP-dependent serine protease
MQASAAGRSVSGECNVCGEWGCVEARHSARKPKKNAHGNTGKRNAAKPVQKQSLTIRLPPEVRDKALARPESASVYIERLIRCDKSLPKK